MIVVAASAMLGPWKGIASAALYGATPEDRQYRAVVERSLKHIPSDATTLASIRVIPRVAARETVIISHYAMLGVGQFAAHPYLIPPDTQYALLDVEELRLIAAHSGGVGWAAEHSDGALERLLARMAELKLGMIMRAGDFMVLGRGGVPLVNNVLDDANDKTRSVDLRVDSLRDITFDE